MNRFFRSHAALIVSMGLCSLLAACSGSTKTVYHTLAAADVPLTQPKPARAVPSLGVGPVKVPTLLDRRGVVLRKDQYTVEVSELHEWGGELEDEFLTTLTQHLQLRLPDAQVRSVPWELEQTPLYQVTVNVVQFDGMPAGKARLRGRWQLQLAKTGKGVRSSSFDLERQVDGDSVDAIVRAQSHLLNELADQIVTGLNP
ncbi:MAG: PqiC family protein [Thiolinea sp.]